MKIIIRTVIVLMLIFTFAPKGRAENMDFSLLIVTSELAPFVLVDPNGMTHGSAVAAVRYALDALGIKYQFRAVPWARAQYLVRSGAADAFMVASRNAERDSFAVSSEPLSDNNWAWFYRKDAQLTPQSESFAAKARVSSYRGSNTQKWLENSGYKTLQVAPVKKNILFHMLLESRLDAVMMSEAMGKHTLSNNDRAEEVTSQVFRSSPVGIYFSKAVVEAHPEFLPLFNKHIREFSRKE